MQERIAKGLETLFERHRVVFWYDTKQELRRAFEALQLPDVEKVELANNEFGVKHRILREAPRQRFLLYRHGPEPALIDNWLLDVQLAEGVFRADQAALWLAELGLGAGFEDLVREHETFFAARKRMELLQRRMRPEDTRTLLRLRMLSICAGADGGLDTAMESLLGELAEGGSERLGLTRRVGLEGFLWDQAQRQFGYHPQAPSLEDFAITLFQSAYADAVGGEPALTEEAQVFLRRWKNNRNYAEAFEKLSGLYAGVLNIAEDLANRDFRSLVDADHFEEIDREIVRSLVHAVATQTAAQSEILGWIRKRRQTHWYPRYRDLYEAIGYAVELQSAMTQATLGMTSLAEGVERYVSTWYRIDQIYRKFVFHMQRSGQASLMQELGEKVENLYTNGYLLRLNDAWQAQVDAATVWKIPSVLAQQDFYAREVKRFRRQDQKICVIISDALRYEVGQELLTRIRKLDRFEAEIVPLLSVLPSYTQLGMAALLPHAELRLADNGSATVLVDGESSQGLENRTRILAANHARDRATALKAEALMALHGDDARALVRDHDVLYVYHNAIDAIGDKRDTEERTFEAAEDALEELVKLVRKLTSANATNLIVTADHGFLYQHRVLQESDFSGAEVQGENVLFRNRRFVLGKGLQQSPGLAKFTAAQVGLAGDMEMLLPKSINRLRLQGAGSRFVHGGAALQEVVVPVLRIHKSRQSDLSSVEVEILVGTSRTITSSQVSVVFYQSLPVTEKVQPRTLRAGLYAPSGELISDSHDLVFDFRSDNPRERELPVRFLLSRAADAHNGQEVILKLEERHGETSHFREYRSARYLLRRSFTSDFDF